MGEVKVVPKAETGNTQVDGTTVHTDQRSAGKAEIEAQQAELKQIENKTVYGAPVRTPKQMLLDASDVQARYPDQRIRWVNIQDPQVAQARRNEGYRLLSAEEGGRAIGGELALMAIPRELYDARVKNQTRMNNERLDSHKTEVERIVTAVARELRDKHGIRVDERRLFVNED